MKKHNIFFKIPFFNRYLKRLNNLHDMLDYIRINEIDGDLLEAGVWRGGVTIFMKAYLDFYKINRLTLAVLKDWTVT